MEILGLVDVPLYVLLAVTAVVLTYIFGTWNHNYFKKRGIPGPAPYPFVGNSTDAGFMHDLYAWSQQYGSIYGIFVGRKPALVITDLEILKEVLVKHFDNFRNRMNIPLPYPLSLALFVLEDDAWKRVRNTMTPTFTGVKLRRMCVAISDCSRTLTRNFSKVMGKNDGVNMKAYFGAYSMDVIAQTAFGIKVDSQNDFNNPFVGHAKMLFQPTKLRLACAAITNAVPVLEQVFVNLDLGIFPRKVITFFETITADMMNQRRHDKTHQQEPRTDFLQLMMDASVEEGGGNNNANGQTVKHSVRHLSTEEIVAQCILFFNAGYETTGTTLTFIAYNLARYPDVQEKAYNEIKEILGNEEPNYDNIGKLKYLDNIITETLRLYPPAIALNRVVSETIQIKGLTLSKGQTIFIPVMAIHRNPQLYNDPDSFKPERYEEQAKTISFQAFGFGPRICIGMRLALVEVKVALVNVLRNVKFERMPGTPDVLTFTRNPNILQAKQDITLKLSPRC
ncbi:cytochrome P450 3A29-like [Haliotis rufescens]|uniref:cytochrome P450 3A29-like n=1 Tax=Haliotis rufescens TaxID=6454 RepID=UPI00201F7F8B|nr:cytochrome P450 3A29-like [Haliotis rufescens]